MMKNLLTDLPTALPEELVTVIAESSSVRIERIVSSGHASPDGFWCDQREHEWVVVLRGRAILHFESSESVRLNPGDHILIPAHKKHRIAWTTPDEPTVWIAVFYCD